MRSTFQPSSIRVVAGIGNSEEKYLTTYHNAGMRFVSFLLEKARETAPKKRRNSSFSLFTYPSGVSLLLSSLSMNLSGDAIKKALSLHSIQPKNLLLVHDDSDLPLGSYRFSFGRGAAGHRGVQSVIETLGTNEFWRLRIGIRDPLTHRKKRAEDFVLSAMPPSHLQILQKTFSSISSAYDFIRLLS
ncbi:MAG: aminoacyl-tRNA hydrolase [Nanoarchaeota archaeon]|nr:aminoacyl-tRNA hydrolase [Nanoarchaeota archaeon]